MKHAKLRHPLIKPAGQLLVASVVAGLLAFTSVPEQAESIPVTSCAGAAFLQNGGFESGSTNWRTTATDGAIEVWSGDPNNPTSTAQISGPGNAYTFEGSNLAELQANPGGGSQQSLYQDISTVPGTVIRWSFRHHHRTGAGDANQVLAAEIGPIPSNRNITGRNWTGQEQNNRWNGGTFTSVSSSVGPNSGWQLTSGSYTVPADQTVTRFMFSSVTSPTDSYGNLLDDIRFTPILACPVTGPTLIAGRTRSTTLVSNSTNASSFNFYGPAGTAISSVTTVANSGVVASASGTTLQTSATNSGSATVNYFIRDGNDESESTVTYTVLPEAAFVAPAVIPIDPRVSSVTMPALPVTQATNAFICVDQVFSSTGSETGTQTFNVRVNQATSGVSATTGTTLRLAGTATNVGNQVGGLVLESMTGPLAGSQSRFVRIRVSSTDDGLAGDCMNGTSRIVEIRPYDLEVINIYNLRLRN
jgi:hypothetical protein